MISLTIQICLTTDIPLRPLCVQGKTRPFPTLSRSEWIDSPLTLRPMLVLRKDMVEVKAMANNKLTVPRKLKLISHLDRKVMVKVMAKSKRMVHPLPLIRLKGKVKSMVHPNIKVQHNRKAPLSPLEAHTPHRWQCLSGLIDPHSAKLESLPLSS